MGLGGDALAKDLGVSTITVPLREIGAVAATLLIAGLSGAEVEPRVRALAPSLIVRETTVFPGTGLRAG